jgi:hypothetical protein
METVKKIAEEILEQIAIFEEKHQKFVDKGNKKAGMEARKSIGAVKNLVTAYRKASNEAADNIKK